MRPLNKRTVLIVLFLTLFIFPPIASSAIHYPNASGHPIAQKLFDKGMLYYYGYAYTQAEYDFRQALLEDPQCGLCYWGLGLAKKQQAIERGESFARVGFEDIEKARQLVKGAHDFPHDLIEATKASFSLQPHASTKLMQKQYIDALRVLYQHYKQDPVWREEALALFVDAIAYYSSISDDNNVIIDYRTLMSCHDYKQEALDLLKPVLASKSYPDHPGLLHTYIHMTEHDLTDPLGLIAAKKLPAFSNGMIAHFTHMSNHIYWHRGMYHEAIASNLQAIKIDEHYFKQHGIGLNTYYYEYHYLHSHHFLSILGVLTNNYDLAIHYARQIKALMDVNRMQLFPDYRDEFLSLEHLVLARFEKWQKILDLPVPAESQELAHLYINFSRSLAYLHLNQQDKFEALYKAIQNTHYQRECMQNLQHLVVIYLQATKLDLNHATFSELEETFVLSQATTLQSKLLQRNPPVWFFPYELFLSDAAFRRSDPVNAKKYQQLVEKIYPHTSLGRTKALSKANLPL